MTTKSYGRWGGVSFSSRGSRVCKRTDSQPGISHGTAPRDRRNVIAGMDDEALLRVFMSYRRDDAAGHAGRLYDSLISRHDVADVFMDVGNIEPGLDFTEAIAQAIETTDVMLVLIGPRWVTAAQNGHRRLDDPDDHVVAEIAAALGRDIRVIPVLLENAAMPSSDVLPERIRALANRNAIDLSTVSWSRDVDSLVAVLHSITPSGADAAPPASEARFMTTQKRVVLASIGVLILGGAVVAMIYDSNDTTSQVTTSAVTTITPTAIISVPVTTAAGGEPDIVLEAESGAIESPMSSAFDELASGGRFVGVDEPGGAVHFTFEVDGGDYVLWARAAASADDPLTSDSFSVAVDGGERDIWDLFETTETPPIDWSWDQVSLRCGGSDNNTHQCNPKIFALDPGRHTLSVLGREDGAKLDVIVIRDEVEGRPEIAD